VPMGAGSHANSGYRFVKGKSAAQIVDEHGLDAGCQGQIGKLVRGIG